MTNDSRLASEFASRKSLQMQTNWEVMEHSRFMIPVGGEKRNMDTIYDKLG